ncbi:N-acetylmannosamine-6-phosphate 2-epimerase [Cytobacillus gottheilii]|uniref:N-acylglucosamine-6-phosphate 2-epimerase n=1 Tax=Cytobacillus gottheilii TaxID=859144 RepID=A0ABX8FED8_9BACI|nr:N-acetylmannosamine-6-phosphate 2-epimerase [Cytobacillus gottheilii]QVY62387.1 N-acetylmannosamine-6-phosphate 2-epimerase [Cytobacillus gottheilii]
MQSYNEKQQKMIQQLKNGLIVSCQAKKDDPMYMPGIITGMAKSAIWGGAAGLRLNTPEQISEVRQITDLPIIGLWKQHSENSSVFITPTMEAVDEVIGAGADIVAIDATDRINADGEKAYLLIEKIKQKYPETIILADIRNEEEAVIALEQGAHMVAPTLYRFNDNPKSIDSPDFEMLAKIVRACEGKGLVLMEGKINTPEEAIESLYLGAYAVVVGSAITRPHLTTLRFTNKINKYENKMPLYY